MTSCHLVFTWLNSAIPYKKRASEKFHTAEGVNDASVLKIAPLLLSHRSSAMKPAPTSKTFPEASGPSGWQIAATKGATYSG